MARSPVALALYALLSVLFFGRAVVGDPDGTLVGSNDVEPSILVWFFAWWPDALLEGVNPFRSEVVFAPEGLNTLWATHIMGPSLLFAPLTLAAGPVVSYNVFSLVAPALSAWTAFLLFRHVTRTFWPSVAGGYVFGFSPFILAVLTGAPNLAFLPLLPLIVLLLVRRLEGSMGTRSFVALMALVLVGQYLANAEVLAMTAVFGGIAAVLAWLLWPERRASFVAAGRDLAVAGAIALVVVSPVLYHFLFKPHVEPDHAVPVAFSSDLLSFAFPTPLERLGRRQFAELAATFGGGGGRGGGGTAYLGLPLLAIVVLYVRERLRTPLGKLLTVMLAVVALASLGPKLHVAGHETITLPWRLFEELPLLEYALPGRFPLFMFLVAGLVLSLWLARRPSAGRWALTGLAIVFLLPNATSSTWEADAPSPAFFTDDAYEDALAEDDRVVIVPSVGGNVRWQAERRMDFELAGGYLGRMPDDYDRFHTILNDPAGGHDDEIARFLYERCVNVVAVADPDFPRWRERLRFLPVMPREEGGVLVYRLPRRDGC